MHFKSMIVKGARQFGLGITRKETLDMLVDRSRRLADIEGQPEPSSHGSAEVREQGQPADAAYASGMEARASGNDDLAFLYFARSLSLIPRHGPTMGELRKMSADCLAAAADSQDPSVIRLLVRAVEMNPNNEIARQRLDALIAAQGIDDLTKHCFIFPDAERARAVHANAYERALDYIGLSGVVGDVLEFGVLGGWSARILCELMRNTLNLNRLHLFDSFDGLPEYESEVDRNSYEIGGRNIWSNKMRFPDDFRANYGGRHDLHIRDRLAEIIRIERISVHKGFYSETLKENLPIKASLVHVDCDLYQSTVEVLWGLHRMKAFQDGCVILFDDWNCNRASPNYGERRAFREFMQEQNDFTSSAWFTYGYNGAAFILHDPSA
jgi:hypothetical protein